MATWVTNPALNTFTTSRQRTKSTYGLYFLLTPCNYSPVSIPFGDLDLKKVLSGFCSVVTNDENER